MVAPLVGEFSALQAVMKPASNAAAKNILVRTLITGLYPSARNCKVKMCRFFEGLHFRCRLWHCGGVLQWLFILLAVIGIGFRMGFTMVLAG
jgi:hypothetical protein